MVHSKREDVAFPRPNNDFKCSTHHTNPCNIHGVVGAEFDDVGVILCHFFITTSSNFILVFVSSMPS